MVQALTELIETLEQDGSLREPHHLGRRLQVLDRIEHHLVWGSAEHQGRLRALQAGLDAINREVFQALREDIRQGRGAQSLRRWTQVLMADAARGSERCGERYDDLDALLSGVLQLDEPAGDIAVPAGEMVFYQPTPARDVFELIDRAGISAADVLIDLGSGLGHVPLLAGICTDARCIGIECEAAYVDCARRCAQALELARVTFVHQDVRAADLSVGTVFHLYTPFTGAMLRDVLGMLRGVAAVHPIRVAALGPCVATLGREPWLERTTALRDDRLTLFRSVLD